MYRILRRAATGSRWAIGLVAALFAAAHIPGMIANGVELTEFAYLLLDAALVIAVFSVVQRAADVWWFWGVHFAMDMMQFGEVPAA